jgi:hypothetical protein
VQKMAVAIYITTPTAAYPETSLNFPVSGTYGIGFPIPAAFTSPVFIQVQLTYDNTPDDPPDVSGYFGATDATHWSCPSFQATRATEEGETASLVATLYGKNLDGSININDSYSSQAISITITN